MSDTSSIDFADMVILFVAMIAVLLGVSVLATGAMLSGLGPLIVGLLGFAYVKADTTPIHRWLRSRGETPADEQTDALTVLRQRYAAGEIDHAEFERRLNDLLETETLEEATKHRSETVLTERSQ